MAKRNFDKLFSRYEAEYAKAKAKGLVLSPKLTKTQYISTVKLALSSLGEHDLYLFTKNPNRAIMKSHRNLTVNQTEAIERKIRAAFDDDFEDRMDEIKAEAYRELNKLKGYSRRQLKEYLTHYQEVGGSSIPGFAYIEQLIETVYGQTFQEFMESP